MARVFLIINRTIMVPLFRLGLGLFVGNPVTGYIMVLKTIGRTSGKVRFVPVNYAILDGHVYCMAGLGRKAHWYRNLLADPAVELILPSGAVSGTAEDVTDSELASAAVSQVVRNSGIAGFMLGLNPFSAPESLLREKTKGMPLVRIRPTGVAPGAADAGGWLWVLVVAAILWVLLT
jgi:deazaflavin-dependent oxidoreductase (nitroreductase family)